MARCRATCRGTTISRRKLVSMGTSLIGVGVVKNWFDQLEGILAAEATLAGLMSHNTTKGNAREFLVANVLRRILPTHVHVGTGQILHSDGNVSRQVDIVLYDPRFPQLEVHPGMGLYFAEGVIAAIEVKSLLTRDHLVSALDNCASAIPNGIKVIKEHKREGMRRLRLEGLATKHDAEVVLTNMMLPKTFVFAFQSRLSHTVMAECIENSFRGKPVDPAWPVQLPRVIVAGESIAITTDSSAQFDIAPETMAQVRAGGPGEPHAYAAIWKTKHRFGLFASNVAAAVTKRMGTQHAITRVRYAPEHYLPFGLYTQTMPQESRTFLFMHSTAPDTRGRGEIVHVTRCSIRPASPRRSRRSKPA